MRTASATARAQPSGVRLVTEWSARMWAVPASSFAQATMPQVPSPAGGIDGDDETL